MVHGGFNPAGTAKHFCTEHTPTFANVTGAAVNTEEPTVGSMKSTEVSVEVKEAGVEVNRKQYSETFRQRRATGTVRPTWHHHAVFRARNDHER